MQLIMMRHPPVLDGLGRCYGRLDLAADDAAISHSLAALEPYRGWPVFSSPARRCRQLADTLHPAPEIWPELQELDFGQWEGLLWDEIPRADLDAWAANIEHYRPGGGESAAMLQARWHTALARWQAAKLEQAVVVSHAGVIRLALVEAGKITEAERWNFPVEHARAYVIEI